ncbi:unnamed protein product [Cylindrotheca closterium]|uniref:SET domain-containing protein n=1 Tax=Cylindrotheca closterium TaxID=2856 RepID=A0AAD2FPI6_9STRA|nr:unnamed protein product [Cylindrotheca closterium]
MLRLPLFNILLLLNILGHGAFGEESAFIRHSQEVHNLIQWLESAGGFLDSRVEIRRLDPEDPSSYFGVFANAPIQENEILMRIPGELKIQIVDDGNDWEYDEEVCELSWMLKAEFEKGDKSKFLPYINYLRTQVEGQIPGAWSSAGQGLLLKVQGGLRINGAYEEEEPSSIVSWLRSYAEEECAVGDETLDPHFIALTVQRGYDSALIPIYDMLNHSNHPEKVNTMTDSSLHDFDDEFTVQALRHLKAGEELHYAYHDTSSDEWGTPEILRDFGFVEGYPHTFHISDGVTIVVDQVESDDGQLEYVASCLNENCPESSWIEEKVQALMEVEEILLPEVAMAKLQVPPRELAIIKEYHQALLVAFSSISSKCPDPDT